MHKGNTNGMQVVKIIGSAILAVLLVILFVLAIRATDFNAVWDVLKNTPWYFVLLFIFISYVNFAVYALRWDIIAHAGHTERKETHIHFLGTRFITNAVSYLIPSAQVGGEPFRIMFLEKSGFSRKESLMSVIVDKALEAGILVIFGVVSFFIILMYAQGVPVEVYGLFMLFVVLGIFFLFFYLTIFGKGFVTSLLECTRLVKLRVVASYYERIQSTEQLMKKFFTEHTRSLLATVALTIITYFFLLLEYYVLFMAFGVHVTFGQLIVVSTVPTIAYIVPIPGAAGALELSQIFALQLAHVDPKYAIPLVLLMRVRDLLFILTGFLYASSHGVHLLRGRSNKSSS